ncbi:MAG: TRAP transporter large permease [Betaproteobacteria bacterium]|nr:TRAP transporter large permease [Betaproteobacteria bacterium]NBO96126.1 TRAP transporter large permease [Betaproteobacteria bacterium]NBP36365.1 TRAP transporter large permease [Betaproteobacteria bacterium]NBP36846.1 TRAP transporter large permease [Betaproteobacteria bacterium]NBQ77950.1 TRAP transporter large permease [Betaproteobacteria bacterium]
MFNGTEMFLVVGALLLLTLCGVHIAIALGFTAAFGIYLMQGDLEVVKQFVSNTAYEALRDYVFAVIPLFMLMGEFLARCGAARDVFALVNRVLGRLPGRLGIATIFANAVFAFVTGVSIAAAAAFSRIAYPEMRRHGYERGFALGCVAGSACLGMLIPPSVLMIVWGILTEQSIGRLFLAGIVPGILLVIYYCAYVFFVALTNPARLGEGVPRSEQAQAVTGKSGEPSGAEGVSIRMATWSTLLVLALVVGTLGGIWLGAFTPTEGAGVGAVGSMIVAVLRGLRLRGLMEVIVSVGRTSAPLLLLLITAQLYSRVLSMTGITAAAKDLFVNSGLSPGMILLIMVGIWFVLGCLIDSISIILLTVPVFAPVAQAVGFDPLAFAIMGIIAIETGLLTPPFGILVFTVRAALPQEKIPLDEIFRNAIPYWICLLVLVISLGIWPQLATWLPAVVFASKAG